MEILMGMEWISSLNTKKNNELIYVIPHLKINFQMGDDNL